MYRSIAAILIFLAGWTLAANILVIVGGSLNALMLAGPLSAAAIAMLFLSMPGPQAANAPPSSDEPMPGTGRHAAFFIAAAVLAAALLRVHWMAFWAAAVAVLVAHGFLAFRQRGPDPFTVVSLHRSDRWIVLATLLFAVALSLTLNRPDADDAFYVAVAAFTHAHPGAPLLATDPMHGEQGWSLLFPSYRFASYELLAAALARLSGMPAMDIMYRLLTPLMAALVVTAAFFLGRQLSPRRWVLVGVVTVALCLFLGEGHHSFGNFAFVRIFQGKSIYMAALVPLIFALTFRCVSPEGSARDVVLLACAQLTGIGLSNFGMLAAPMAAGTALAASALTAPRAYYPRLAAIACTLFIALPCLLYVATTTHAISSGGPALAGGAAAVWLDVAGKRQQYLVAALVLAAPALAPTPRLRAWLAIPPLIALGVLLNPWLAHVISTSITTTSVYWRATWCFPLLGYLAWGLCSAAAQLRRTPVHLAFGVTLAALLVWSSAFTVVRASNGVSWQWAGLKIPESDLDAAKYVAGLPAGRARVLAPERLSNVIARFEDHPRLVLVRDMYVSILRASMGEDNFAPRMQLRHFINGTFQPQDVTAIAAALGTLDVETVVTPEGDTPVSRVLASQGYVLADTVAPYGIWRRTPAATGH